MGSEHQPRCRRCGECAGRSHHHWMADPQEDPLLPEYSCKHCSQRGRECVECGGEGCWKCFGEGVTPATGTDLLRSPTEGNLR